MINFDKTKVHRWSGQRSEIGEVSKKERLGKEIREVKRCLSISGKDKSIVEDIEVGKEMGTQHDDNLKHEIKTNDKAKTKSVGDWLGRKEGKRFIIP